MPVPQRQWSLRRRLVLGIVALLAFVSIVIGGVSIFALNASLTSKLDEEVRATLQQVARFQGSGAGVGGLQPKSIVGIVSSDDAAGTLVGDTLQQLNGGPPTYDTTALTDAAAASLTAIDDGGAATTVTVPDVGTYRFVGLSTTDGRLFVVGLPTTEVTSTVGTVAIVVVLVVLAGLAIAFFVGTAIVRLALRPLERVTATASHVSELELDRGDVAIEARVSEEDSDPRTEVGQVGAAINRMLGHVASALTARESSERKLRIFVADASHELRTPLASIRGYAELTRRGAYDLPPDVVHALGRVESESVRMTSLVEDLLLLARLDDGRELEKNPVDLTRLLTDAVSDAYAAGQDHEWALEAPEEPIMVSGDAARLHQVVVNLLANARVHTPAGTSVVTSAERVGDAVVIRVTDDGPGISPTVLPTVFERFARGDSSRSRIAGSTGLGLAIVSAVVDAHGGTVGVESAPGRTVFTVTLPGA
jgi:two-component system OmpR family sensor kinase